MGHNAAFSTYKHKNVYFSDILVEKKDNNYYEVIDSKIDGITKGDKFTENDLNLYFFKTFSPKDKSQYLIGILSEENVSERKLSFNNESFVILFHKCRLNNAEIFESEIFHVGEVNQVTIVNVKSFLSNHESSMNKLVEFAKELRNKNRFILNLYDNGGGTTIYPENFIRSLNDVADWKGTFSAKLWSPASIQFYLSTGPFTRNVSHYVQFSKRNLDKFKNTSVEEWKLYPYQGNQEQTGSYEESFFIPFSLFNDYHLHVSQFM